MNLFVYGSLKRGLGLHGYLAGCKFVGEDRLDGFDMFSAGAFPYIGAGSGSVKGEVYEVGDRTIRLTDMAEGVPTLYRREKARTEKGIDVWVYVWARTPTGARIEKGEW